MHTSIVTRNPIVTLKRIERDGRVTLIFVQYALRGGQYFYTNIMDQNGKEIYLTEREEQTALSLAKCSL